MSRIIAIRSLWIVMVAMLAACGPIQPTNFYTLESTLEIPAGAADPSAGPVIGVGPIVLPQYLDRPQIVTRGDGNRILLADFNNWGEPVQSMVERVLVQDIGRLIRTNNVVPVPTLLNIDLDAQVEVEIFRFEADDDGAVTLEARWRVLEGGRRDPAVFRSQRAFLGARVGDPMDYNAIAGAMSELLAQLAREISNALIAMPKS